MTTQHIALVVDRSGSMSGKEGDTIGGINACIEELKNQKEARYQKAAAWESRIVITMEQACIALQLFHLFNTWICIACACQP